MNGSEDLLTYENMLKIIIEAKNITKKNTVNLYNRPRTRRSLISITGTILNKLLKKLGLELRITYLGRQYQIHGDVKAWAIDFLEYLIMTKPTLCLRDFNDNDKKEIMKFVKNKIYCALLSAVDIELLFDDKDLVLWREYRALRDRIKRKGNYYVLESHSREYRLPINHFEMPVFYHKYGVPELPREVIKKLEGRDFIDGGAFIGDSALVLSEFKPRKIYAFEPLSENYLLLLRTIQLNNLSSTVVPVKKALGASRGIQQVIQHGSASFISEIFNLDKGEEIEVITLDEFVVENNLEVGFIKLDVEGYELEVLTGAKETIKRFKPVMSISIYHRGQDFFEIPRLVKNIVPEYRLRFLNLNAENPVFERILLTYTE